MEIILNRTMIESLIVFVNKYLIGAMIASIGGLVHIIYRVSNGDVFSLSKLLMNMVMAAWIWYLTGEIIPMSSLHNAYVSISWFCAWPLLNLLETQGVAIIKKYFNPQQ